MPILAPSNDYTLSATDNEVETRLIFDSNSQSFTDLLPRRSPPRPTYLLVINPTYDVLCLSYDSSLQYTSGHFSSHSPPRSTHPLVNKPAHDASFLSNDSYLQYPSGHSSGHFPPQSVTSLSITDRSLFPRAISPSHSPRPFARVSPTSPIPPTLQLSMSPQRHISFSAHPDQYCPSPASSHFSASLLWIVICMRLQMTL